MLFKNLFITNFFFLDLFKVIKLKKYLFLIYSKKYLKPLKNLYMKTAFVLLL